MRRKEVIYCPFIASCVMVLVLDRAPGARIRFEVRARNEFFDLQPILARYRRRALAAP